MILNDRQICTHAMADNMIKPYEKDLVREVQVEVMNKERTVRALSFGQGSFGYDIRLSPKDFRIFDRPAEFDHCMDPKEFDSRLVQAELRTDSTKGSYFVIPGNSYALGVSLERVKMPPNVVAIALGKSTYARCGIIANITPIEPGWEGHITLEFSNAGPSPVKIYANEGVVQLLFFKGETPNVTYASRKGKYQNQGHQVTVPRT